MKYYVAHDLNGVEIGRSTIKSDAIKSFRARYPFFDSSHVEHFIDELIINYNICLPEYEGYISKKMWKKGKIQSKVCETISYTKAAIGVRRTQEQIYKLWKLSLK